jgi:hypothetical protein
MNWWLVASRLKHGMMTVCPAGRFGPMKEHVSGLGATTTAVLETTTDIFGEAGPSNDEEAALELSEKVAEKPLGRAEATAFVSDLYKLATPKATSLIDLCKSTAIIDEETDRDRTILFNSNTFREGQYAKKALLVLQALTADDWRRLGADYAAVIVEGAKRPADATSISE